MNQATKPCSLRWRQAAHCATCGREELSALLLFVGDCPRCTHCVPLPESLDLMLLLSLDLAAQCWYGLWSSGAPLTRLRREMTAFTSGLNAALVHRGHPAPDRPIEPPALKPRPITASRKATAAPNVVGPRRLADPDPSDAYAIHCSPGSGKHCAQCTKPLAGPFVGFCSPKLLCPLCLAASAPGLGRLLILLDCARTQATAPRPGLQAAAAMARLARQVLVYGALLERQSLRRLQAAPLPKPCQKANVPYARSARRGSTIQYSSLTGRFFRSET